MKLSQAAAHTYENLRGIKQAAEGDERRENNTGPTAEKTKQERRTWRLFWPSVREPFSLPQLSSAEGFPRLPSAPYSTQISRSIFCIYNWPAFSLSVCLSRRPCLSVCVYFCARVAWKLLLGNQETKRKCDRPARPHAHKHTNTAKHNRAHAQTHLGLVTAIASAVLLSRHGDGTRSLQRRAATRHAGMTDAPRDKAPRRSFPWRAQTRTHAE